ncbi:hypothetical protein [Corynebacterium camporealensis]
MHKFNVAGTQEVLALRQIGAITPDGRWIVGSKLRTYLRSRTLVPTGDTMMEVICQMSQDGLLRLNRSEFPTPRSFEIADSWRNRLEGIWAKEYSYYHMARAGVIDEFLEIFARGSESEKLSDLNFARTAIVAAIEDRIRDEVRAIEDSILLTHMSPDVRDLLGFPYDTEFNEDRGRSWGAILAGRTLGQLVKEAYLGKRKDWIGHPGFEEVYKWAESVCRKSGVSSPVFVSLIVPKIGSDHRSASNAGIFGASVEPRLVERGKRIAA